MKIDSDFHVSAGPDERVPWVLVIALTVVYAYAFLDRVVLTLMVEPIRADLGITDLQISLLLGLAFAFFYALLNLPAGYLADRFNRKTMIAGASVGWAFMTIWCGLSHSFIALFMARAGVGLAEAIVAPAAFTMIRDATPPRLRGTAFSIYSMSPIIGGASALIGGGALLRAAAAGQFLHVPVIGTLHPWRAVLVVMGMVGVPFSLLLLLFDEPRRRNRTNVPPAGSRVAWAHVRDHGGIYVTLIGFATFGAMIAFGQNAWLPALLGRRFGLAPAAVGPMIGPVILVCGLVGLAFSGWFTSRIERRGGDIRLFGAFAAFCAGVGMAGVSLVPNLHLALVCIGVGLFFVGVSFPVAAATLSMLAPAEVIGLLTGAFLLFQNLLGSTLGPMLIALAGQYLFGGGPASLIPGFALGMVIYGVLSAGFALMLWRQLRRRDASTSAAASLAISGGGLRENRSCRSSPR